MLSPYLTGALASPQPRLRLVASALPQRAAAAAAELAAPAGGRDAQLYSGLEGKALGNIPPAQYPSMAEVLKAIPKHCFERDTLKSLGYAVVSSAMVAGLFLAAFTYIPLQARAASLFRARFRRGSAHDLGASQLCLGH